MNLEHLLHDIELALKNELYFIALQSTLLLPEICSSLQSENGKTNGVKYAKWYDTYAKEKNSLFDGDVCYYFRCSIVHQGRTTLEKTEFKQVVFAYPDSRWSLHNNVFYDILNIDLVKFCENMISSVRKWESLMEDNPVVQNNYKTIIQVRSDGMVPFIQGIPFIY